MAKNAPRLTLDRFTKRLLQTESYTVEKRGALFEDMAKLLCFAQDAGIRVYGSRRTKSCYYIGKRKINLSLRTAPTRIVSAFLHELGHAKVENWKRYKANSGFSNVSTKHEMVNYLEEEFEAWHQGWIIAKQLGLKLDKGAFERYRAKCLLSYTTWAHKKSKKLPTRGKVGS